MLKILVQVFEVFLSRRKPGASELFGKIIVKSTFR